MVIHRHPSQPLSDRRLPRCAAARGKGRWRPGPFQEFIMSIDRETTSVGDYERQFGIAEGAGSRGNEPPCEAGYPVLGWLLPLIGAGVGFMLIAI
jgi:hypothetical protein